jgi:hypothetical protein
MGAIDWILPIFLKSYSLKKKSASAAVIIGKSQECNVYAQL